MGREDTLLVRGLIAAAALVTLACAEVDEPPAVEDDAPRRWVWAWDRPEDLRFLDPTTTAVALFESIVTFDHEGVQVRPRHHPMQAPPGTNLVGVVRVESAPGSDLSTTIQDQVVEAILAYHRPELTRGLQIDFDARLSERDFYRDVLEDLRRQLPVDHGLTITALASWCLGDPWLDDLPIDDAVPMLFRMGPDAETIRAHLNNGGDFSSLICRQSIGLSTDEPQPRLPGARRLYLFHPRSWTPEAFAAAVE